MHLCIALGHRQWCGEGLSWGERWVEEAKGKNGDICDIINNKNRYTESNMKRCFNHMSLGKCKLKL